ncbi:MAG: S46 family peptidase [Flavobacteriales bacterium]|nr:S46 family peptidase [Flavobacteriales bacterium]
MNTKFQKISILLAVVITLNLSVKADEGMWLPLHIKRLSHVDMQKQGLQLTAEEIYSINKACLKDAIVMLNRGGCTAEMISSEGLMLTNHHCAYGVIQKHSSIDNDYLTNGFWAMSRNEELPAYGASASFLIRMEDMTKQITTHLTDEMTEGERAEKIKSLSDSIAKLATADTDYDARVKSFFHGNEFYLFVYETFTDVRLVGAPPSSIGKFGGNTDNWMWPRHTGDFSLLRVYCDKDGKGADYSPENVAYKPKHHLPISLQGVEKGDYAMIMGYPGSTDRYLTSYGVKQAVEIDQPARVLIRGKKLEMYELDMNTDPAVRIMYASKHAGVSNYYKYFQGQMRGLKRLKVYDKKKAQEDALEVWINEEGTRKKKYGEALTLIEEAYVDKEKYLLVQTYFGEAVIGVEAFLFSYFVNSLYSTMNSDDATDEAIEASASSIKSRIEKRYENYNQATDQKVFAAMMELYYNGIKKEFHPDGLTKANKKYKGNYSKMAADYMIKSVMTDKTKMMTFLDSPSKKVLDKDPIFQLFLSFYEKYVSEIKPAMAQSKDKMTKGMRLYSAALREMQSDKIFAPDANSTMRITYGSVGDYIPMDAVSYKHYTTLAGVMEKENQVFVKKDGKLVIDKTSEFYIPEKLKDLYNNKDYGQYGKDGQLNICFIANLDITGGNSGSPVINGKGELIGCAFDGNWEAMSGDIAFEPELQRTIAVDIRYVLFIIDKYAGATHLIDEMTLVNDTKKALAPVKETTPTKAN